MEESFFSEDRVMAIKAKIETFVPKDPESCLERDDLFADLRQLKFSESDSGYGDNAYPFVLSAIYYAYALHFSDDAKHERKRRKKKINSKDDYWGLRKKVETAIQEIQANPIVKLFPSDQIEFFSPDNWICSHGRKIKECYELYNKLGRLLSFREFSQGLPILCKPFKKKMEEIRKELLSKRIDPREARLEDYCQPRLDIFDEEQNFEEPLYLPESKPVGRPSRRKINAKNYLLDYNYPLSACHRIIHK